MARSATNANGIPDYDFFARQPEACSLKPEA
jgi:hypothetical protein